MSSKHYDIAIVGGSLSARIAAALLAKNGSKVLYLRNQEAKAPAWFHSSIFLEKLLGVLGGRSCFTNQKPIQVISAQSRLTLSHDISLEEELSREFGGYAPEIHRWLTELQEQGVRLEEFFWENGGLPWPTLKSKAQFRLRGFRRRINFAELEQPVAKQLALFNGSAKVFLTDLLQGLSLTPVAQLPYACAAMLWAQALRPESLIEPDFSELLSKRFDQFHGAKATLDDLKTLDFDGSKWTGGQFKSGAQFSAKTFLLGDWRCSSLFSGKQTIQPPCSPATAAWETSDLTGQLSLLLRTRVICGGETPLRLAIEASDNKLYGLVRSTKQAHLKDIRKQLEPILPFARYELLEQDRPGTEPEHGPAPETPHQAPQLSNLPIRIVSNLYWADRTALLPEMGAAGAALLASTLLENLSSQTNRPKG